MIWGRRGEEERRGGNAEKLKEIIISKRFQCYPLDATFSRCFLEAKDEETGCIESHTLPIPISSV